jgi:hypothetical protein
MNHKTLKLSLFSLLSVTTLVSQLTAGITINITAEKLKDPGGFDMATSGVVALVADIGAAGFSGPSATALEGDDFLVGAWSIGSGGGNSPGAFLGEIVNKSFSGDWGEGDDLALYFFPTLALTNPPVSAAAVPYGMFRVADVDVGLNNTDLWVTPTDGTFAHDLIVLTTDATTLGTGSSPAADGLADGVTPGTAPADPTGIAGAADGPGKINVTWTDNATDEEGYRIERSIDGGVSWALLVDLAANTSMHVDTDGIQGSTSYLYRVIALRGASQSAYNTWTAVVSSAALTRLLNLSNRAYIGVGESRLIGSAITSGARCRPPC